MPRQVRSPYDSNKTWLTSARLEATIGSFVYLNELLTSDPGSAGAIWNDSGTVRVSGGSASVSPSGSASPST